MRLAKGVFYGVTLPIILIALWWVAALANPSVFLPTPDVVAAKFVETWIGPRITQDVLPSIGRFLLGTGLAIVIGIALGLFIGLNRTARAITEPLFEFFRALPPPVLVPVLMLLVGTGDLMKLLVIVSGCLWPVLLNTVAGVRAIDPVQTETTRSYRIDGLGRIRYQVLPSAAPQIFAGVRQALPIGLILMVISEMFASSAGLGFTIVQFQRRYAVPEMWTGIILLGLIGIAVSFAFRAVERLILRWYFGLKDIEHGE